MVTFANISRCQFKTNRASGIGGAIYVFMKSKLKIYNSQFTLNRASSGGSVAVAQGDSFIQSCNFNSDTASNAGGCIAFDAAIGTVTQSDFSDCKAIQEEQWL